MELMEAFRLCVVMVMLELFSLAVVDVARQRVIDDSSQGILGKILNHVPLLSVSDEVFIKTGSDWSNMLHVSFSNPPLAVL